MCPTKGENKPRSDRRPPSAGTRQGRNRLDDRGDEGGIQPCEVCGFPVGVAHRLKPGEWGGGYTADNVVYLCPNHHRGVHHLMTWYLNGFTKVKRNASPAALARFDAELEVWYFDHQLHRFFFDRVKPVIVDRLKQLRLWHNDTKAKEDDQ